MKTPQQISRSLDAILPEVKKPGRYTGGELNQIIKDWGEIPSKVALFFPEIYDLGMSNLALMILYDLINRQPEMLAERAFLPWTDMEEQMRSANLPLFSLESRRPLQSFDMIGVFLPYESVYTNLLSGLDLAEIPLLSGQRSRRDPLVVAGGHAVYNPEPAARFIDAFLIGEGEEVFLEVIAAQRAWQETDQPRQKLLESLSLIDGVYVPSLYKAVYDAGGQFSHLDKLSAAAPDQVIKRIVPDLPPPPTDLIVPYIDIVHDRAPLEIMRGCTRGCRFCHAGMVNRPVRERSVEEILKAIEQIIPATGYSEIGLLSLSSSDYTKIVALTEQIQDRFGEHGLSISLPSLRIETVSVDLMDNLAEKNRSGFTLAPEAASPRMRQIINKTISDQQLLDTAREIYSRGWHTIKLYFMIGLPGETLEDVRAIADLSRRVRDVGENVIGRRAQVHVSVGNFVPKPHTPFQWVPCDRKEILEKKITLLQEEVRGWGLKLNWNSPEETLFEAWLSRGDRRLGAVIQEAWQQGAKFDNWSEHFDYQRWLQAFDTVGLDPAFYAHRNRSLEEAFPWDHIDSGVKKAFLQQDYRWSEEEKIREDCRGNCFACGILPTFNDLRRDHAGDHWLCPDVV
jgi:radical SAM family uncharacterized protein